MKDLSTNLYAQVAALRRYAMALGRDRHEADDLVQETLKRAIAYARKGGEVQNMRAFLFTVLHNVWINERQKNGPSRQHLPLEEVAEQVSMQGNQYARSELNALLRVLRELPENQRQVILLVGLEGFAYREVAAMTGVPVGTVMSRLSRARKALTVKMREQATGRRLALRPGQRVLDRREAGAASA